MQKLIEGVHEFQTTLFSQQQQLFENLVEGQEPEALFITCSDSRISPNLITQTEPGDLFILRTAGNIVPPYGAVQGGEAGTIEYAVSVLKVPDIIICGHSHCGAMGALLEPEKVAHLPAVTALLKHAEATKRVVQEMYPEVTDPDERIMLTVEENVLMQLENLRTHPAVAAALSMGRLNLHGWVYEFETGDIYSYDPVQKQFVTIKNPVSEKKVPAKVRHAI